MHFFKIYFLIILMPVALSATNCLQQKEAALACFRDQEHEMAFQLFLEALDHLQPPPEYATSPEEQSLYEEAWQLYITQNKDNLRETAQQILTKYGPSIAAHPDYHLLGFLIAAAYANLDRFSEFFERFYESYRFLPDHYLAYKNKASLHAKLFVRMRELSKREIEREHVLSNIELAIQKNPSDTSLYQMKIGFSRLDRRNDACVACLNKIISANIIVPRNEIAYYAREALAAGRKDLSQQFIDLQKKYYRHSQAIDNAQEDIDRGN